MSLNDYRFELPEEAIAQYPLAERSASRMMVLDGATGEYAHRRVLELPALVGEDDLLVFNDTRVVKARLFARKVSGGRIEALVERVVSPTRFFAHLRASKSPKPGGRIEFDGGVRATVLARTDGLYELELGPNEDIHCLMEVAGAVPLPPYIRRAPDARDPERYQSVFARRPGAVAAPTASLHFDEDLVGRLDAAGVRRGFVTLHVGAGTFMPVRDDVEAHVMHAERVEVSAELCAQVEETRARGGRVVAIGTTCVRALESAAAGGRLEPLAGETRLFIRPGHRFRCVDAMLTNFHLPDSTLLMLVCAFAGRGAVMGAYDAAVRAGYRFFSYGDAMFIPAPAPRAADGERE